MARNQRRFLCTSRSDQVLVRQVIAKNQTNRFSNRCSHRSSQSQGHRGGARLPQRVQHGVRDIIPGVNNCLLERGHAFRLPFGDELFDVCTQVLNRVAVGGVRRPQNFRKHIFDLLLIFVCLLPFSLPRRQLALSVTVTVTVTLCVYRFAPYAEAQSSYCTRAQIMRELNCTGSTC